MNRGAEAAGSPTAVCQVWEASQHPAGADLILIDQNPRVVVTQGGHLLPYQTFLCSSGRWAATHEKSSAQRCSSSVLGKWYYRSINQVGIEAWRLDSNSVGRFERQSKCYNLWRVFVHSYLSPGSWRRQINWKIADENFIDWEMWRKMKVSVPWCNSFGRFEERLGLSHRLVCCKNDHGQLTATTHSVSRLPVSVAPKKALYFYCNKKKNPHSLHQTMVIITTVLGRG